MTFVKLSEVNFLTPCRSRSFLDDSSFSSTNLVFRSYFDTLRQQHSVASVSTQTDFPLENFKKIDLLFEEADYQGSTLDKVISLKKRFDNVFQMCVTVSVENDDLIQSLAEKQQALTVLESENDHLRNILEDIQSQHSYEVDLLKLEISQLQSKVRMSSNTRQEIDESKSIRSKKEVLKEVTTFPVLNEGEFSDKAFVVFKFVNAENQVFNIAFKTFESLKSDSRTSFYDVVKAANAFYQTFEKQKNLIEDFSFLLLASIEFTQECVNPLIFVEIIPSDFKMIEPKQNLDDKDPKVLYIQLVKCLKQAVCEHMIPVINQVPLVDSKHTQNTTAYILSKILKKD